MTGAGDAAELGRGAAGVQLPGRLPQGRGARQHQHQGGADLHAEYVTPTPATTIQPSLLFSSLVLYIYILPKAARCLSDILSAAYLSASGAVDNHWIGLNDMSREGGFIWSDGSAVAYVNWDDGEPNNSGEEDCGLILAGKGGVWNDAKCDDRHKVGYNIILYLNYLDISRRCARSAATITASRRGRTRPPWSARRGGPASR